MGGAKYARVAIRTGEEGSSGLYHLHHHTLTIAHPIGGEFSLDIVQESKLKGREGGGRGKYIQ